MKKPVRVIDYPGHHRLRTGLTPLIRNAACIVFMVDANSDAETLTKCSDLLYELLTNAFVYNNAIPLLVACNKSEMTTSKGVDHIKSLLESELNEVRSSRTATPGMDQENEIFLGVENEKLVFSQIPVPIQFIGCSVKNNEIKELLSFIENSV
uniref:Signal recognition particle receptor subunit beta n=1 Tax=Arcella intermedia TaxID=1963864 RepID=A0A6B2LNJ9_9EUKA